MLDFKNGKVKMKPLDQSHLAKWSAEVNLKVNDLCYLSVTLSCR